MSAQNFVIFFWHSTMRKDVFTFSIGKITTYSRLPVTPWQECGSSTWRVFHYRTGHAHHWHFQKSFQHVLRPPSTVLCTPLQYTKQCRRCGTLDSPWWSRRLCCKHFHVTSWLSRNWTVRRFSGSTRSHSHRASETRRSHHQLCAISYLVIL